MSSWSTSSQLPIPSFIHKTCLAPPQVFIACGYSSLSYRSITVFPSLKQQESHHWSYFIFFSSFLVWGHGTLSRLPPTPLIAKRQEWPSALWEVRPVRLHRQAPSWETAPSSSLGNPEPLRTQTRSSPNQGVWSGISWDISGPSGLQRQSSWLQGSRHQACRLLLTLSHKIQWQAVAVSAVLM